MTTAAAPEPVGAVCRQCAVRTTDQETGYSGHLFGQPLCRACLLDKIDRLAEGASS